MKFIDDLDSISRASSGWLKDWFTAAPHFGTQKGVATQIPVEKQPDLLFRMYETDATVFATVNTFVNKATSNGWRVESENQQQLVKAKKKLELLAFDLVLPNLLKNMVVYGDGFLELEYTPGTQSVVALHVLETTQMEIVSDEHGDVKGYVQRKGGKDPVRFSLDEVIHFKWLEFGGRLFGMSQLKTLMTTVATKKFAENYNTTTFQNYAPRMAWNVKSGSDEQMKTFIKMLKAAKDNPHQDIVINGDVDFKPLVETRDDVNFIELQKFLREQIMMTTQVPPIMLGLPDNSNRSSSEAQMRAFESNVKALHRPTEHSITQELFPLLGLSKTAFFFNPLDKRNEKDDLEIAQGMANVGIDDETILDFLRKAGLNIREEATIKKPQAPVMLKGIDEDEAGRKKASKDEMTEPKTGSDGGSREDQLQRSWEYQLLRKQGLGVLS